MQYINEKNWRHRSDTWVGQTTTKDPTDYKPEMDVDLLIMCMVIFLVGLIGLLVNVAASIATRRCGPLHHPPMCRGPLVYCVFDGN